MDAFEVYRSPSVKVEPRWTGREAGREDNIDRAPVNDGYRRRSPGKTLVDCSWLIHVIVPSSVSAIFFFKISEIKFLVLLDTAQFILFNPFHFPCVYDNPGSLYIDLRKLSSSSSLST